MSTPHDGAVIPAAPVLNGELIEDDTRSDGQRQQSRQVASWWRCSPRVPAALKSRAHARQAAKDATVTVIGAPWRCVSATPGSCPRAGF